MISIANVVVVAICAALAVLVLVLVVLVLMLVLSYGGYWDLAGGTGVVVVPRLINCHGGGGVVGLRIEIRRGRGSRDLL